MKTKLYFMTLVAILAVITFSSPLFAQDGVNDSDTTPGITTNSTGVATDEGFNPLWLLPLIAIPILAYLFWPRGERDEISEGYHSSQLAGAKGGKSRRVKESEENAEDL